MVLGYLLLALLMISGVPLSHLSSATPSEQLCGCLIMTLAGLIWMYGGRCFWLRQWWRAILCTLVAYGVGVFAAALLWSDMYGDIGHARRSATCGMSAQAEA